MKLIKSDRAAFQLNWGNLRNCSKLATSNLAKFIVVDPTTPFFLNITPTEVSLVCSEDDASNWGGELLSGVGSGEEKKSFDSNWLAGVGGGSDNILFKYTLF